MGRDIPIIQVPIVPIEIVSKDLSLLHELLELNYQLDRFWLEFFSQENFIL